MFAVLLFAAAQLLNREPGQAYEIIAQLDCKVSDRGVDLNEADSTSSMASGNKEVSLLFTTHWPADEPKPAREIGLLAITRQGETVTLEELEYGRDYVPTKNSSQEAIPRPTLLFGGFESYSLSPRDHSNTWDYEESRVLLHGSKQAYRGVCELTFARE